MKASIKKNVAKRLFMASDQHKEQTYKAKNFNTLKVSMEALTPKGDLFVKLHQRMEEKLNKYDNIITLEDIKTRIFSDQTERFSLSMKGLKMKGMEAVFSVKDKKISFLKDGVFFQTYLFLTPTILKKV